MPNENILKTTLDGIITIFRQPALFIGFITFFGLVLQKKGSSDIIRGAVKSIAGVLVLFVGVDVITSSISPMANSFTELFQIEGAEKVADFSSFLSDFGKEIGAVMLFGFIGNLLVAKFTPFKTIYLAGNLVFWFAMLFVAVGVEAGFSGAKLILFATAFQLLYIVVSPWVVKPFVEELTGEKKFTIGHTASIFCITGAIIGKFVGNSERSAENIKLPKFLEFFRDTTVVSGLILFIVNLVVVLTLPAESRVAVMGKDYVLQSFLAGMKFSAGMVVLLTGVRMMLSEIIPAFEGISRKLIKGVVPALDIPLIFPYGQNSLIIGFIVAIISSITTIFILGASGVLVVAVMPLTIACYFDVAPGAIFANKRGGIVAVIVSSAINGALLILLVAVSIPIIASTAGSFLQIYGGNDFSLWVIISRIASGLL